MEEWQKELKESVTTPRQLAAVFPVDAQIIEKVAERYPMRITPHYLKLISRPGDPIWRQCVPDVAELDGAGFPEDPLCEDDLSPVPHLVHRYPRRVLLLVSGSCAMYCRFCTRKRKVGCGAMQVSFSEVLAGIDYIAKTQQVNEVILSGGDPLMMSDLLLGEILGRIARIPHVELLRLATRTPAVLPARITESLCTVLRRHVPLFLTTHFNHPTEITPESAEACARLADAGIPLGNQTVLMKGVNDSEEVLAELFTKLLRIRVRPYYLHHMDTTAGTAHFRTTLERGMEIVTALRASVSGLAIPHYIVDTPGGKGKVPILTSHVEELGETTILKTAKGERVRIPNSAD